jgi:hypothetical protein
MSDYTSDLTDVNKLGYFLDGWAEIIEGMAGKEVEVRNTVLEGLKNREMPEIGIQSKRGVVQLIGSAVREYIINTTDPGVTTAVYIAKHGKDLYASWKTFIRPVIDKPILVVTLTICALLGLIVGGIDRSNSFYSSTETFSFGGWIGWTIVFLIIAGILLGFAGRILRGNALAFFFVEPTIFDADDIAALSISVHKTILRSLDQSGIDVSKLLIKQSLKGGRRGEDV